MLRAASATRYVAPLREGGSLPGLVEADDEGLYVVKFRGAGQGVGSLIAEVIAGELARALGLSVPEIVTIEVDPVLVSAEPDPEIQALVRSSGGLNAGLDFLPGALTYHPAGALEVDAKQAALIASFDAWVANVDRTSRNPNLLVWHDRLWLIDHGAALYHQHGEFDPVGDARRPLPNLDEHVLTPVDESLRREAVRDIRALVAAGGVQAAVAEVPDAWLSADPMATRARYITYLRGRADALEMA